MADFRVGMKSPGWCGGAFPLETMGEWLRVEYVAYDWIVVRSEGAGPLFYCGDLDELERDVEAALREVGTL